MAEMALQLRDVHKAFGATKAVAGINLEVRRGECFGLLGPNGAGKTTTLEMIEGIQSQDQGEIVVLGMGWKNQASALRPRLGVALQETHLFERLTVLETLQLFRSAYAQGYEPLELLRLLQLNEKKDVWSERLSGGQRQRLALGCALVGKPELLILDEPTTGLDPQSRRTLWELIRSLKETGTTILLTTHYMDEAEALCDRVAVVDHGQVIALGTAAELIAKLDGAHMIELETEPALDATTLQALEGLTHVSKSGNGWLLNANAMHIAVPALVMCAERAHASINRLTARSATLEDVFVQLTGRHLRDD